jgi:maltooligosyltrehalose trehalohydrolase
MTEGWILERGATTLADGATRFSVWAPYAKRASVVILESDGARAHPLEPNPGAVFTALVPDVPAGTDYFYRLDDERDRPDPVSRHQARGVHGPSRVVDPQAFSWSDAAWRGPEAAELIIYELHVGAFTAAGTFAALIERLPYLSELGVTAIELMPVGEFPGRRNWGYDGVFPYAPHSGYGGPEGLRRLVDAAHAGGLAVLLDVVYNHLGPAGNYLAEFGPYFTDRYPTPWGKAINYDGPDSDEVRRYFIDNALYWISEFHIDGLRLDAVQAIFDFSARHILDELADAVQTHARRLGRRALVIAESDLDDPRIVRPRELGGFGLDAMWSDDFHHAIHALLTGERGGYYSDFGAAPLVVKALRDRFVLDGRYSRHHRRRHGAPAGGIPADRFVICIQNHDQVGNRAGGERLSRLVALEPLKLAAALLLLAPYVPLLFMGEEYGERRPFLYFVDHEDPALASAVWEGRRRELARFDSREPTPDPGSLDTFLRSRIDPNQAGGPPHRELSRLYHELIRARRAEPALRPGAAHVRVESDADARWAALAFEGVERPALAVFNLAAETSRLEIVIAAGAWVRRLGTDDRRYGGGGPGLPGRIESGGAEPVRLTLPAYVAALYTREAD